MRLETRWEKATPSGGCALRSVLRADTKPAARVREAHFRTTVEKYKGATPPPPPPPSTKLVLLDRNNIVRPYFRNVNLNKPALRKLFDFTWKKV